MSQTHDSPPPEVIAALTAGIKETLGTVFIGFCVATTLYGITILQAYLYYRSYPKDSIWIKLFVALLWTLDTLTTTLVAHSIYTYSVLNFGNLLVDEKIPWSFSLEKQVVDIVTLLVQCYYARQLFILSPKKLRILPILIVLIALAAFGLNLKITVQLFANPSVQLLSQRGVYVIASTIQGLCALCDILITGGLVFTLRNWRSSGISTHTTIVIDNVILYAVTRGVLTTICQIIFMSFNASVPDHTYWQPFHQAVGKLYVNSVLASLNFRTTSSESGTPAVPGIVRDQPNSASIQFGSESFALSTNSVRFTSMVGHSAGSELKYLPPSVLLEERQSDVTENRENSVTRPPHRRSAEMGITA